MLDALISSKTRIKLLIRLFLNPESSAHLRGLADEFAESTNSVRIELNRLEEAGFLNHVYERNKKIYRANRSHPLFSDINSILWKYVGIDQVIFSIARKLGSISRVYLVGDYVRGKDSGIIDLVVVGGDINRQKLTEAVEKTEKLINKKIRYLIFNEVDWERYILENANISALLLWYACEE